MCAGSNPAGGTSQKCHTDPVDSGNAADGVLSYVPGAGQAVRLRGVAFFAWVFFVWVFFAVDFAVDFVGVFAVVFFAVDVDLRAGDAVFFAAVFAVDFFVSVDFGVRVRPFSGVTSADSPSGSSPRACFAARTLFSKAAIRSITWPPPGSSGLGAATPSPPSAFAAIISSTAVR